MLRSAPCSRNMGNQMAPSENENEKKFKNNNCGWSPD
jgi:hypothetical protein